MISTFACAMCSAATDARIESSSSRRTNRALGQIEKQRTSPVSASVSALRRKVARQPLRDHGVGLQWSSGTNSLYHLVSQVLPPRPFRKLPPISQQSAKLRVHCMLPFLRRWQAEIFVKSCSGPKEVTYGLERLASGCFFYVLRIPSP